MTVVVIGPAVSCVDEMGMTPVRLMSPTVGLTAASELAWAGLRIEPDVSVPTPTGAMPTAMLAPVPELEPLGVTLASYGLSTWPPSEL